MPLVASALPFLGLGFLQDKRIELGFIVLSAGIGGISLIYSYFKFHRCAKAVRVFLFGLVLQVIAHMLFEDSLHWEITFAIVGAAIIAIAHYINRTLNREFALCESHAP